MGAQEQAADWDARRYEIHRETARQYTQSAIRFLAGQNLVMPAEAATASLTAIDAMSLVAASNWTLPWRRIVGQNRPYFRRFELALWRGSQLYGLAVGRASRGPDNVTIHYLERAPDHNPFAGYFAQIAIDAADRYAKLIVRQRVKLRNPVLEVIPKYRILGFSVAETIGGAIYYARQV